MILLTFPAILVALEELQKDNDSNTKNMAKSVVKKIKKLKFILMLVVFKNIFDITSPVSKYLQSANIDFFQAVIFIDRALEQIITLKSRDHKNAVFSQIEQQAKSLANKCNIEPCLEVKRKITTKRVVGETCSNESLLEPLDKFRSETFFVIVDALWSKFKSDFKESKAIVKEMSIFQIDKMSSVKSKTIVLPSDSFKAICNWLPEIDMTQLKEEYLQLCQNLESIISGSKWPTTFHLNDNSYEDNISNSDTHSETENESVQTPQSICELFKLLSVLDLRYTFPNVFLALKALCTLPIGSASAERKFSKMKLIKTRLRSTTNDSRLEHMMLLTCEGLIEIDFDKAIDRMGTISSVYKKQLMPS